MNASRGNLLVKPIETQEVVNGIVLLEETRQRWVGQQCEVIATGSPGVCDDEDCERFHSVPRWKPCAKGHWHPVPCAVGDWIVVKPRSYTATDVDDVWVVRQDDVLARLVLTE